MRLQPFQILQRLPNNAEFVRLTQQVSQPLLHLDFRLFHQGPHRQAKSEAARPLRILKLNTIPKPCEHDGGCFAEAGWNVDELRTTISPIVATSKPSLVVEWFMARGAIKRAIEKTVEARRVHRSLPSPTSLSRCPILNCMKFPQSRQSGPGLRRFLTWFCFYIRTTCGMRARKLCSPPL